MTDILFSQPPVGLKAGDDRAAIADRLGDGERLVVVTARGRKWAQLLAPGSLRAARVPLAELERGHPADVKPKRLARRIAAKSRSFDRLGVAYPKQAVKRAIAVLT